MDAEKVISELQSLTRDLYYISESEALWQVIDLGKRRNEETIEELLEEKTGLEKSSLERADIDSFFKTLILNYDPSDEIMEQMARQYQCLLDYLIEHFCKLYLFRSGETQTDIFLIAETNKRQVIALQTSAVET